MDIQKNINTQIIQKALPSHTLQQNHRRNKDEGSVETFLRSDEHRLLNWVENPKYCGPRKRFLLSTMLLSKQRSRILPKQYTISITQFNPAGRKCQTTDQVYRNIRNIGNAL